MRRSALLFGLFLLAVQPAFSQTQNPPFGPTGDVFAQQALNTRIKNNLYVLGNLAVTGQKGGTGNFSVNGTTTLPNLSLTGTSFSGTLDVLGALGQNTAYVLPDPGVASANILLDTGVTSALTIQHVTVPLTSANLLAMSATPVNLIPAGAAGTNIVVHHVMFTMVRTATAYASGGVVVFQLGTTATGAGTATTATVAASVLTTAGAATTYTTVIPVSYTGTAATGLYISNQTGAFTTGTGTAMVDVWYSIK